MKPKVISSIALSELRSQSVRVSTDIDILGASMQNDELIITILGSETEFSTILHISILYDGQTANCYFLKRFKYLITISTTLHNKPILAHVFYEIEFGYFKET